MLIMIGDRWATEDLDPSECHSPLCTFCAFRLGMDNQNLTRNQGKPAEKHDSADRWAAIFLCGSSMGFACNTGCCGAPGSWGDVSPLYRHLVVLLADSVGMELLLLLLVVKLRRQLMVRYQRLPSKQHGGSFQRPPTVLFLLSIAGGAGGAHSFKTIGSPRVGAGTVG